ncbi:murein biosynthesis integral membrane protein MurJ [Massilia scottii]|uniref:murein biosynthesis integral membrane protein MurJ n=1 Tax=Massilia scottii TaxID=3057166 RepID=UPI002796413B|nr:murein biosynthesis integral membrane protein MurJ [Massilia sp. CCM 9029]MDQ1831695.1 murein biosynthesis integral membrane protein MurJ [Massilia sp. CCM 9029]
MNLLKTLAAISSMTMLSRVTGLLRESLFARAFGASEFTDAFNVAFRIPNLLRRMFAEGAFAQAFVPILADVKTQHGDEGTRPLVDSVATVLIWSTLLITIAGIIATPLLIMWIMDTSRQTAQAGEAAIFMTRVMFPYIICMAFVSLASGILNTWRQFKIPAFTPVLLNISFILASLFLAERLAQPIYAMAIAVVVGGLLQVGIQIPSLMKIGMLPRISLNPFGALREPGVHRMLKKMGPAVFAVSAAQISLLINTGIASRLGAGSVSALTYADRLMEFPTAMLGVALGTILLPSLAKANAEGDTTEYSALLNWGLRLTFLLALPASIGLAALAEPMIATLFHYGAFNAKAIHAAAMPLMAYSAGLVGIILVKTLTPAFYARQDVRTPVRIAIGVLVAVQLMNLLFVPLLGVAGLALSIGTGACLNAAVLYTMLRKRGIYVPQPGWLMFFAKLVIAVSVMGLIAYYCKIQFEWAELQARPWLRAGALFAIVAGSAMAYFVVLFALGFRFRDFKRSGR